MSSLFTPSRFPGAEEIDEASAAEDEATASECTLTPVTASSAKVSAEVKEDKLPKGFRVMFIEVYLPEMMLFS